MSGGRWAWLVVAVGLAGLGCGASGVPVVRAQYDLTVPLVGAPRDLVQGGRVEMGAMSTGEGSNLGLTVGARVRPFSSQVGGGSFDVNVLGTSGTQADRSTFLFGEAGLGVLGSTVLSRDDASRDRGNTFDLFTPHAQLGAGYGLGKGFAVSLGISLQYLWHVWNDYKPGSNQLLLGVSLGVGLFDPGVGPDDHVFEPFLD